MTFLQIQVKHFDLREFLKFFFMNVGKILFN